MRTHVLAAVMTLGMAVDGHVARADQCYYDSDCPAGTVCRYGACVQPGYQSPAPSPQAQPAGKPNGTIIILGVAVIVLAVVLYVSVQQDATEVPQPLLMPMPALGPPAQGLGFSVRF